MTEDEASLAVDDANAKGATEWRLVGRLVGGAQSGAWRLRSTDGSLAVLKLALTQDWANQMLRAARSVARVRAAGYPTPAWLATGVMASGVGYQIQELVSGRSLDRIGIDQARAMIEVLELEAELDPDAERCWSDFLADDLGRDRADLRAGASAAGAAGEGLLAACDRLLHSVDQIDFPRHDMVHGDFRPANILFEHGRVAGVIDIEAVGSGTRVFDYATLLDHPDIEPDALELIVASAAGIAGPTLLRVCFAHVALDLVRFIYTAALPSDEHQRAERVGKLTERAKEIDELTAR